ncbi:Thermophilic serine proteinase [Pontiella desulfatans]|uniref:Probable pectate lyase C n=1 Tax=Pontiella desulfatans TaxID=2750659 RepID=A0A6C2U6A2_PONDE|nr:Thermophilic serine proteinase [Pontiella desulfatans]
MFAGCLLAIGIAMFGAGQKPRGKVGPEPRPVPEQKGTSPVAAEFGAFSDDDLKVVQDAPVSTNSVSFDATEGCEVLDERQTMLGNGDVEHRRLVKRSGKHPHRIVVETLHRDRQLRRFVPTGRTEMVADQVLVSLRAGADEHALRELAASFDATVSRSLSDGRTFIVKLQAPSLDAVEEAIGFFSKAAAEVAYSEPDYVRHFSGKIPNDLMYGDLWGMPKVSAPDAWQITTGSKDTLVAVIDTGMDMDHADLLSNLWVNEGEIAGDNFDNDGNGYVDDVNGWDFVGEIGDNDPDDGDGHGTHCAGTIGAVGNNANQVVGVCWEVSIMPLRVGTSEELLDSDIVDGIRYAARNGAKVLSNSYGGEGFSQTMYNAVSYANDQGAIFVAAAGNDSTDNDSTPQYPASYDLPNIVSVAATDENDNLADFSNYGASSVDLAAPGVSIVSTYLNGDTATLDGTSMACPHVAGAMALLVTVDPMLTPAEAKQLLLASVDPVSGLSGKVETGGRLNVHAMFANANDADKDGMPDQWEELYGLNPNNPHDAGLDGDNDHLTNLEEFQNGCDPTNDDSDDDSLVDGWEIKYNFNPLNVHGSLPRLQYLGRNSDCIDAYDLVVKGNYAYVADGAYGLKVLDLTDPASPELVGSYSTTGDARGIDVEGNYAYVADYEKGLFIIDVSNPANPVLKSSLSTTALKVDVVGDYAYVAAHNNGFKIASVASKTSPSWKGTFSVIGLEVFDVAVSGTTAYVGVDGANARFNVSNPASPTLINQHISGNNGVGMFYSGGRIYSAANPRGVIVYNSSLQGLGEYATSGTIEDVCYGEGLIYVADGVNGFHVLDGSDPANIQPYVSYDDVPAYGVTVANGYAYVAGDGEGIQIFRSSVDADHDGMYDGWEMQNFGTLAKSWDGDEDGDAIINWGEYLANLNPNAADQDNDGLIDGADEVRRYLTDPRKQDTDNDGLADGFEVTTNATDNIYLTDPLNADTDGDEMTDGWEIANDLNPLVKDGELDLDNDGASNRKEEIAGTDPSDPDTDDDGMPDGWEFDMGINPLANDAALDPDEDTFTNLFEYELLFNGTYTNSTHPKKADTDVDGLTDPEEVNIHGTDPTHPDTDGDGMPDGWEVDFGLDPLSDVGDDGASGDMDGDGLLNYEEYLNGSNPFEADTDGDGFLDPEERALGTMATNRFDPVVVDDNAPFDSWMYGGQPFDPLLSDTNENGSLEHPFDAIQEAINVASNGFTVLVREGRYLGFGNRDINPGGLELRIMAENQADPSKTLIKTKGLGAGFIFDGGQTTNMVLAGFSIWSSLLGSDCSNGDCGEKHGIICTDASSPLITNCVVEYCRDDGIYCDFNSSPVLSNVTVRSIYEGHGIYAKNGSTPSVLSCTINSIYEGCGILAEDSVGLDVMDTTISFCQNDGGPGRGIWLVNDETAIIQNTTIANCQGGIRCDNSSPMIDRCTLSGNEAPDYFEGDGSFGFWQMNIAELAASEDSGITDVTHVEENGGGILLMSGSFPVVQNCVIVGNQTWASDPDFSKGDVSKPYYGLGGGLFSGADCSIRLVNCTVADNLAMTLGGGFTTYGNHIEYMRNDILWGNVCSNAWLDTDADPAVLRIPGDARYNTLHCNEGSDHFDPWYCVMSDGQGFIDPDASVFDADPLFVGGGDYHIVTNSPCIDVGTYYNAPLYDRDNLPRPLDGDTIPNNYYSMDIGAYEYLNPGADTDGDGILDGNEVFDFTTDPTTVDSDGDGMSDGYEIENGLDGSGSDADADADGDGLTNGEEFAAGTAADNADTDGDNSPDGDEMIAGTDATDASSFFYVSDLRPLAGGGCAVAFDTVVGRTYTVYCCGQLGGDWIPVGLPVAGSGAEMVVEDLYSEPACFYKVEVGNQ